MRLGGWLALWIGASGVIAGALCGLQLAAIGVLDRIQPQSDWVQIAWLYLFPAAIVTAAVIVGAVRACRA